MLNFRTDDDIYVFVRGACIHNMLYPYLYLSTAQSINQAINPPFYVVPYVCILHLLTYLAIFVHMCQTHTYIHTYTHALHAGRQICIQANLHVQKTLCTNTVKVHNIHGYICTCIHTYTNTYYCIFAQAFSLIQCPWSHFSLAPWLASTALLVAGTTFVI